MHGKLLGIFSMEINATGQLLIIYIQHSLNTSEKWKYNEAVHQLFTDQASL
jgi:hypothetical protein